MEKVLLIVNPAAGVKKNKEAIVSQITERLKASGKEYSIKWSHSPGDIGGLVSSYLEKGYSLFLVMGGDGTINEAANALWGTGATLGILPTGSGNGLARSLNLPQNIEKALDIALEGKTLNMDRGVVNGQPFYCTFGVGLDASVSFRFSQEKHRGRTTYIKDTITEYTTYEPQNYRLVIGDRVFYDKALLIAVCNSPQYGNNAYIAPEADLTDGLLDITVVKPGGLVREAIAGISLFIGTLNKNELTDIYKAESVIIERECGGPAHIDGEAVMMPARLKIDCQKGGLKVMIGENFENSKKIINFAL